METVKAESWSLQKIASALKEEKIDDIRIEVPKFQRNLVWTKEQKETFIDSVKRGFPIGTLLFFKKESGTVYSLIDGLQRSTTIRHFIENPTQYFRAEDADDVAIDNLYELFEATIQKTEFSDNIRTKIQQCLLEMDLFDLNLIFNLATKLIDEYAKLEKKQYKEVMQSTIEQITPSITGFKKLYDDIAGTEIPIIIYSGSENNLPTIFERINNQGTTLGKYQIYAASWAVQNYQIEVENDEIIKHIIKKYEDFIEAGYTLQGYDKDEIEETRCLTIFEYVLGFGKYISAKYPNLFARDKSVQDINQIGFELINACLGRTITEIKTLHEKLHLIDINLFEKKIVESIDYVNNVLKPCIEFKGNSRDSITLYHGSYQIISIIASTFRERYDMDNVTIIKVNSEGVKFEEKNPSAFQQEKSSWSINKGILARRIPQHYVYDIISKNWADGNAGKLNSIVRENKYLQEISLELWESKLDDWNVGFLTRREKKNVSNPKPTEKLFLNCIYVNQFSAMDQLSQARFDIEHLATKEQMKKINKQHNWEGFPISAIGNLCYLPEYDNRKKKEKTIYQDKNYLEGLGERGKTLQEVEEKYTFTQKSDMEWIEQAYSDDDYGKFMDLYCDFVEKRFKKMKKCFYLALGIIQKAEEYVID